MEDSLKKKLKCCQFFRKRLAAKMTFKTSKDERIVVSYFVCVCVLSICLILSTMLHSGEGDKKIKMDL